MEHYKELMERVKCIVEERLYIAMVNNFSNEGDYVSLYCEEYDFTFAITVNYRDMELEDKPVLSIADRIVRNFECELVRNIER